MSSLQFRQVMMLTTRTPCKFVIIVRCRHSPRAWRRASRPKRGDGWRPRPTWNEPPTGRRRLGSSSTDCSRRRKRNRRPGGSVSLKNGYFPQIRRSRSAWLQSTAHRTAARLANRTMPGQYRRSPDRSRSRVRAARRPGRGCQGARRGKEAERGVPRFDGRYRSRPDASGRGTNSPAWCRASKGTERHGASSRTLPQTRKTTRSSTKSGRKDFWPLRAWTTQRSGTRARTWQID